MSKEIRAKRPSGEVSSSELAAPSADAPYSEKARYNLERQKEVIRDSLDAAKERQDKIDNNPNASEADKKAASILAKGEMAMSMAGNLMGIGMRVSESLMLPMLEQLGFLKGLACLPVLKQTDPIMGIDVHNVNIPPSPVVPMPHPYIGMLLRPKDFLACAMLSIVPTPPEPEAVDEKSESEDIAASNEAKALNLGHMAATMAIGMLGASVKLGEFLPRAVAGTITKNFPHIPMGVGFSPNFEVPVQKDVGHSFLGSLNVLADNDPLSGSVAHLHNDCWDVGTTNLHGEEGPVTGARFYVPSGLQTSIPMGRPVLTNPVPIPINPMAIGKKLLKAGLGKMGKKFRKSFQKVLDKIDANPKLKKKFGGCPGLTKLSKRFGTGVSHPVDVASGHFYTDNIDFSLPGIIPFEFERNYYSYSDYHGPLGVGWHHTYDMALAFDPESEVVAFRQSDGRTTGFELPGKGKSFYNRREKLHLHRSEDDTYHITDTEGLIYSFTKEEYHNPYNETVSHLLQSISNRNGYSLRLEYTGEGVLKQIIDSSGREIHFTHDGHGHIGSIHIPSPERYGAMLCISTYRYDSRNRLISQTDALGHSMRFEYEEYLMSKETWRNGLSWHIRYRGSGTEAKCVEITGDNNLFHYKLHYLSPDCTEVTDSLGHKTVYYHRRGFVTKRIDPNGGEYVFRYNVDNELEWTIDAMGNGEGATHDEYGNPLTQTAADGGFIQLKYEHPDFVHLPSSAIDAAGGRWRWSYDDAGNLIERIDPLGAKTHFEYTDGLLTAIVGARGQATRLKYDSQGNLIETIAPDGGVNRWWYDCLGQCLRYENARGGVTEYTYDLLGQVIRVNEPDKNIRELTYDTEGNVIHAKDSDRDVRFTYRGVNKLASRTERGATLRFRYDTEDQLRVVENEAGEEYRFELDAQGDVITETGFDGLRREYTRDLSGRVTKVKRPNKEEIAYEYDPVGRVTKVLYHPDEKNQTEESYEYRSDGALLKATNQYAEVVLERDVLGRVIKESSNGNEVTGTYDEAGNRIRITSNKGADIRAEYNLMGDVLSLSNGGWQTRYDRDLFGLETGRTLSGGVRTRTDRDRLGRVTTHKTERNNRSLTEKQYLWGTNDKLLSIVSDGKYQHFEYDGWGNLSKTLFEDGKVELRNPDKTGNLFESLDRMDRKYAKGGQLIKTDRWEYKYDKEGNLIRKKGKDGQTWRYEWNATGMLARVKRPDALEVSFRYDALGRRIEKRMGRGVTRWIWDGNVPLHEQRSLHTPDYEEDRGHFTRIEPQDLITWVFEEGTFVPTAKLTENRELSIVTNYLGTPEAMYREDGEKVWSCNLNSYGKVRSFEGQFKTECPFRYQGQYEDAETGLYYNRFRYYSPDEGMYISQDPIKLWGGIHLYAYVYDPNSWIDILGLIAAPKDLPNEPGVYIVTNGKDSYVGSSGIGKQGMNDRVSTSSHKKAQDLLKQQGTTVQFVRVDLGTATSESDRNNILRYYESREAAKQKAKGKNLSNSDSIQSNSKNKHAEALIKRHGASAKKRRTTCKK